MKLNPYVIPQTKMNSRRTKNLNVKKQNVKLLEENIEEYLYGKKGCLEQNMKSTNLKGK